MCGQYAFQIGRNAADDEYERFADQYLASHTIFLATDNADTQRRFEARYGPHLFTACAISETSETAIAPKLVHRHTPLRHAVVDMFTCVQAEVFKGSPFSSFSDAIYHMRTVRGMRHAHDEHELLDPNVDTMTKALAKAH